MPIIANNKYYILKANGKYYDIYNPFKTFTFTIVPTPSDATVTLTAQGYTQVGNSITVRRGTNVSWSVSKSGYISQSGSQTVNADETKNVTLQADLYPDGTIIFESSTPGTYTVTLEHTQDYEIWMVGGGGGGAFGRTIDSHGFAYTRAESGGSGAYIHGNIIVEQGTYTVTVGVGGSANSSSGTAGAGGNTTFLGQTAGGGPAHTFEQTASGGQYTVTLSGLTGVRGNNGRNFGAGGDSLYGGYGKGGDATGSNPTPGVGGYIKIVARR